MLTLAGLLVIVMGAAVVGRSEHDLVLLTVGLCAIVAMSVTFIGGCPYATRMRHD
jgi:hypothetical protein